MASDRQLAVANNRFALDARTALCLLLQDHGPGASERER
jgi:hypothetical protein